MQLAPSVLVSSRQNLRLTSFLQRTRSGKLMLGTARPGTPGIVNLRLAKMHTLDTRLPCCPITVDLFKRRKITSYVIRMTELAFMLGMIAERRAVLDFKIIAVIGDDVLTHPDHPAFCAYVVMLYEIQDCKNTESDEESEIQTYLEAHS